MKYVAIAIAFFVGVPIMLGMAQSSPRRRSQLFLLLAFLPVIGATGAMNFVSTEGYRGPDRGFEVSIVDLICIALNCVLVTKFSSQISWFPPGSGLMILFFVLAGYSTSVAPMPLYGEFTLWKLIRAYWLYWCVVNTLRTGVSPRKLLWGLMAAVLLVTVLAFKQKYLDGYYRVHGPFDHSNTIPLYINVVMPVLMCWVLFDLSLDKRRVAIGGIGVLGCVFCVLATQSRAGIVISAMTFVTIVVYTSIRSPSKRSVAIARVAFVLILIAGAMAIGTIIQRFKSAPEASAQAREEFNIAADMMAADYPLGVGLNNFPFVLTVDNRYNQHIQVMANEEQAGVVHHIYRLIAAELGYVGLALFVLILLTFVLQAARGAWSGTGLQSALSFGLLLGFLSLHLQGMLEWAFRVTPVTYQFTLLAGLCAHLGWVCNQNRKGASA